MKKLTIIGITLTLLLGLALWHEQLFVTNAAPVFNTLTVINTSDSGAGSLRQAIADAAASGDTITFDTSGVFAAPQTITLTTGELVINKSLTIDGPGASQLTVSGYNASRVFYIANGNTVTLDGLTVSSGNGAGAFDSDNGGGIYNNGTPTLTNCTVSANSGGIGGGIGGFGNEGSKGGGIGSNGTVRLINSTVTGNSASNSGGSSLSYDATTDRYTYVWRTNRAWRGTCRIIVVRLSDGSDHFAKFRFR